MTERRYLIPIEGADRDKNPSAYALELPGCIATATTPDVEREMRAALAFPIRRR